MVTVEEKLYEKMPDNIKALFKKLPNPGSDEVVELFPNTKSQGHWSKTKVTGFGEFGNGKSEYLGVGEKDKQGGSAARFFYCAKASKSERNKGCDGLEEKEQSGSYQFGIDSSLDGKPTAPRANNHPTVKPIALMEYLIKLVSREGHLILDPFMGSGTTGIACKNLKRHFIGIERDEEYLKIAKARIKGTPERLL